MSRRKQRRNSAKEQQLSRREDQLWPPVGNWRKTVTICQLHNLRFTGVAGTTAAGAVAAAARLSARAAVDCKFAASISVLACGLDVSTPGEDGPELSSTVGNNWVALDSSEMLLGDATREWYLNTWPTTDSLFKLFAHVLLLRLFLLLLRHLPYGIGCTQWTMNMLRLVGTSHRHASQELLKATARLYRWLYCRLWRPLLANRRNHCRRRRSIACDGRMLGFLRCRLPGLSTWTEFCSQRRWRRRNCPFYRIGAIIDALSVAAATGGQHTATQQVTTIRTRRGGGCRGA